MYLTQNPQQSPGCNRSVIVGVYPTTGGTVTLEVAATDNSGIQSVEFYRWDAVNLQVVGLTTDPSPPYQASIEVNTLNMKWNQIGAIVTDTAGNKYEDGIFIYRLAPMITLGIPEGSPGHEVTATGSGWLPGETVILNLGDPASKVGQVTVDDAGNFATTFIVPPNAAIGEQKVVATNTTTGWTWQAEALFHVTEAEETPTPVPTTTNSPACTDTNASYRSYCRREHSRCNCRGWSIHPQGSHHQHQQR
jgi:Bacterial Ig domain